MSRIVSTLAALALTALATLSFAAPASADPYGPETGSANVSATSVHRGDSVTVSGDRFCPRSAVFLTVHDGVPYVARVLRADSRGHAAARVRLTHLGDNTLKLVGRQGDCTGLRILTAHVQVTSGHDNQGGGIPLPHTGGTGLTPLWAGMGLLAAGGLLVTVAHKRRRIVLDPA